MLVNNLKKALKDFIIKISDKLGEVTVVIEKKDLVTIAKILKEDKQLNFNQLIDITAVDYLYQERDYRFEVVYHFLSLTYQHRVRVKCLLQESAANIDSLYKLWLCADWYERECYDMYGIHFNSHPDLRRILMYDGFEGYPLRKDYLITQEQPRIPLKEVAERNEYMKKKDL